MPRFVVCYDITSDQRRRRVAECLDAYGDRVQDSVFELVVDRVLFDKCLSELSALIDSTEDNVLACRLCASCEKEQVYMGVSEKTERVGEEDVFIV